MHTSAIYLALGFLTSALAYSQGIYRRNAHPDVLNPHLVSSRSAGPKPNSYDQNTSVHARMAYAEKDQNSQLFAHDSRVYARNVYPFSVHDRHLSRRSPHYPGLTSPLSRRFSDEEDGDYSPGGLSGPHAPLKNWQGRPPPYPQRGGVAPPYPHYPPPQPSPGRPDQSPPLNIKQGAWRTLHPQLGTLHRTSPLDYRMEPPTPQSHHGSNSRHTVHAVDSHPVDSQLGHPKQMSPYPPQAHHMYNVPPSAFEMASAVQAQRPSEDQHQDVHNNVAGIGNSGPITRAATARLQAQLELEQSGKRKSDEIYPGYMLDEHMAAAKKKKEG